MKQIGIAVLVFLLFAAALYGLLLVDVPGPSAPSATPEATPPADHIDDSSRDALREILREEGGE